MKIGYACLTVGIAGVKQRTCTIKNASSDVLMNLIQSNLEALDKILDYNIQNGIKLFRISSDIIPFGSHPVNTLRWWDEFQDELKAIGNKALENGMRLSMHPGQYTVLNSPDEAVVERAVEDLRYHTRFLDALGLGTQHKIILHIGGIYGNKAAAVKRFILQYRCLDQNIRQRLVIENDDRQYTISDASKNTIKKVDIFINDSYITSLKYYPFETTVDLSKTDNLSSTNNLRVVAVDSLGNISEQSTNFFVAE